MVGTTNAHSVRSAAMRMATALTTSAQEEEQDRPVAVPDLRLEAPQVADQQRGDQDGHQRVADDGAHLDGRPRQAQRVEHLELLDGDRLALARRCSRRPAPRPRPAATARARLVAPPRVELRVDRPRLGSTKAGGQVAGQLALGAVQVGRHELAHLLARPRPARPRGSGRPGSSRAPRGRPPRRPSQRRDGHLGDAGRCEAEIAGASAARRSLAPRRRRGVPASRRSSMRVDAARDACRSDGADPRGCRPAT